MEKEEPQSSSAVCGGHLSHTLFAAIGRHGKGHGAFKRRGRRRRLLTILRRSCRRTARRTLTVRPPLFLNAGSNEPGPALHGGSGIVSKQPSKRCEHVQNHYPPVATGVVSRARKRRFASSLFTGVTRTRNGRWQAQISIAGKQTYLGTFNTEQAAAKARVFISPFASFFFFFFFD